MAPIFLFPLQTVTVKEVTSVNEVFEFHFLSRSPHPAQHQPPAAWWDGQKLLTDSRSDVWSFWCSDMNICFFRPPPRCTTFYMPQPQWEFYEFFTLSFCAMLFRIHNSRNGAHQEYNIRVIKISGISVLSSFIFSAPHFLGQEERGSFLLNLENKRNIGLAFDLGERRSLFINIL